MRKIFVYSIVLSLCISCNNETNETTETNKDSVTTSNVTLPYTVKETPSWEWGSDDNVAIALNTLKGFETGNIDNIRQYLADTVDFRGDYWHFQGPADSFVNELKKYRTNYTNYTVRMEDYESVKSKKNEDEYVSLWYHETFTDTKGKTDSVYAMDDIKIAKGKVVSIDSKVRHFPVAKPKS